MCIRDRLIPTLDDGHRRPVAPKHLAELHSDVPAAQDQQLFRLLIQLYYGCGVQRRHILQAGDTRRDRPRAGVDEDLLSLQATDRLPLHPCLLYTSDAADDLTRSDL